MTAETMRRRGPDRSKQGPQWLIEIGVVVNRFSPQRYLRVARELKRGRFVRRAFSKEGVMPALFLALTGSQCFWSCRRCGEVHA